MAKKNNDAAANANNNNNSNSNNVNVNVNVSPATRRSYNRKKKPGWLMKAVIGGIIALAVSLIGYYLTNGGTGRAAFVGMEQKR